MTIKKLITVPNEILRKKSEKIEKVGKDEKNLIAITPAMREGSGLVIIMKDAMPTHRPRKPRGTMPLSSVCIL